LYSNNKCHHNVANADKPCEQHAAKYFGACPQIVVY